MKPNREIRDNCEKFKKELLKRFFNEFVSNCQNMKDDAFVNFSFLKNFLTVKFWEDKCEFITEEVESFLKALNESLSGVGDKDSGKTFPDGHIAWRGKDYNVCEEILQEIIKRVKVNLPATFKRFFEEQREWILDETSSSKMNKQVMEALKLDGNILPNRTLDYLAKILPPISTASNAPSRTNFSSSSTKSSNLGHQKGNVCMIQTAEVIISTLHCENIKSLDTRFVSNAVRSFMIWSTDDREHKKSGHLDAHQDHFVGKSKEFTRFEFSPNEKLYIPPWQLFIAGEYTKITIKQNEVSAWQGWKVSTNTKITLSVERINVQCNDLEKCADYHKALLFFYYFNKKGSSISYLDKTVVDGVFERIDQQGRFVGSETLKRVKNGFFTRLTHSREEMNIHSGLILWGPPGTGKTSLVELTTQCGLSPICAPMSPAQFGRPLQGQAEKVLEIILGRVKAVPWLPCLLLLDEIDTLAPKRKQKESTGNEGLLNVVLTIFGGARKKEFENLLICGTTNRYTAMDPAFLRRMQVKIYVGQLRSSEREKLLRSKLEKAIQMDNETLKFLKQSTLGFSGDNLVNLAGNLIERLAKTKDQKIQHKRDFKLVKECVLQICRSEFIRLGNGYLPNYLVDKPGETYTEKMKVQEQTSFFSKLINNRSFTGRVLVDMIETHIHRFLVEVNGGTQEVDIGIHNKKEGISENSRLNKSLQKMVSMLVSIATENDFSFVKFVTADYVLDHSCLEERGVQNFVHNLMKESIHYKKTMVVFDVDSLVGTRHKSDMEFEAINLHLMKQIFRISVEYSTVNDRTSIIVLIFKGDPLFDEFKISSRFPMIARGIQPSKKECKRCHKMVPVLCVVRGLKTCFKHTELRIRRNPRNGKKQNTRKVQWEVIEKRNVKIQDRGDCRYSCCGGGYYSLGCRPCTHVIK